LHSTVERQLHEVQFPPRASNCICKESTWLCNAEINWSKS
jgi:hypothetical protein